MTNPRSTASGQGNVFVSFRTPVRNARDRGLDWTEDWSLAAPLSPVVVWVRVWVARLPYAEYCAGLY